MFPDFKNVKNGWVVKNDMSCAVRNTQNGPEQVAIGSQPYGA